MNLRNIETVGHGSQRTMSNLLLISGTALLRRLYDLSDRNSSTGGQRVV